MSTIIETDKNAYGYNKRIHIKGASEIVKASCKYYINSDGEVCELTDDVNVMLDAVI